MAATLFVVGCGARKRPHPAPAGDLYTGSYHRAAMATARHLAAPGDVVRILSARHGLVAPEQVVEPYDARMDALTPAECQQLARRVSAQLPTRPLPSAIVVLAGRRYAELVRQAWGGALSWPLEGCHGIGEQLHRLWELRQ